MNATRISVGVAVDVPVGVTVGMTVVVTDTVGTVLLTSWPAPQLAALMAATIITSAAHVHRERPACGHLIDNCPATLIHCPV